MSPRDDGFTALDKLLSSANSPIPPWSNGAYVPDLDLARMLLTVPIQEKAKQQQGRTAKAFDAWIAHELRRLGFPDDEVWPRTRQPRVLPDGLAEIERRIEHLSVELQRHETTERGTKRHIRDKPFRDAIKSLVDQGLGGSNAYILGDFYAKQIDVGMSSWRRGPDILISTKTMFSSYLKNLKNRHEEAVGEVDSLRRRHPMAAMGYAYLVHRTVYEEDGAYPILNDILHRLRREGEAFDATMLLVATWDTSGSSPVVERVEEPDERLSASRFFETIARKVTERSPIREHRVVRTRRGDALADQIPIEISDDDLLNEDQGETGADD